MKKFVLFSDLHLDSAFSWMAGDQAAARRRRQALRDTLKRIIDKAVDVNVDALFCGGDLYEHDRFTPDTAAFLKAEFERIHPIPVYISPGNHDWFGPESLYRSVEWSDNVHVFNENHLQAIELDNGLTLWGAAHTGPATTNGFLKGFRVDREGVNLALFHGSERGWFSEQGEGKILHSPFDAEQIERAGIDHAFLGHYHRPKDDPCFTYPGNPDPLSFGEDGERGIVVASAGGDGSVERERVSVAITEAHDLDVDITGCASQQDVRGRVEERIMGRSGVARLNLSGELSPDVDLRLNDLQPLSGNSDLVLTIRIRDIQSGYVNQVAELETFESKGAQAESERRIVEAAIAREAAEVARNNLDRARKLSARQPHDPTPQHARAAEIAQQAGYALHSWDNLPEPTDLTGESAEELRRQLNDLPPMPEGDTEPHSDVVRAKENYNLSQRSLRDHLARRPAEPDAVDTGTLTSEDIRALIVELSLEEPRVDPSLQERVDRAQAKVDSFSQQEARKPSGPLAWLFRIIAAVLAIFKGKRKDDANARLRVEKELADVKGALGKEGYRIDDIRQRRTAAVARASDHGLPHDPEELRALAARAEEASQAEGDLRNWRCRRSEQPKTA